MDATPLLQRVARALSRAKLEAVMVGNAAAALQGAPVTTLDIDFMFRKTPRNLAKLKEVAHQLDAVILKPYYPISDLYRVVNEDLGLQLDFMATLHGVRSFEGLRNRASVFNLDGGTLLVADLEDVLRSKQAAGRPRDRAVLDILERTLEAKQTGTGLGSKPRGKTTSRQKGK